MGCSCSKAVSAEQPATEDKIPKDKDRYDLKDPLAFAKFLQSADVKLVRARYLADLLRRKQPLPRRQEAESETFVSDGKTETALVSHEEVKDWSSGTRYAIVCSVSHAWETREHPDPCKYQLQWVVDRALLYQAAFNADVWIFYDYVSLFQYERDPESHEQRSFAKAMDNMHVMYAHEFNLTFRISSLTPDDVWEAMKKNEQELVPVWDDKSKSIKAKPLKDLMENRTKYEDRGWCKAEVEWSSLRTLNAQHQRIDGSESDAFNGRVPMTPETFKETMRKAEFTHRSDAKAVIRLQEKIFFEKVTACETLVLEGLPATEIEALARALPLYKNMKHLTINKFRCGEREAKFLAEALTKTTALVTFEACYGEGESGKHMAKALAEALKVSRSIAEINLTGNDMADEGTKALAEALKVNRSILNINLAENNIGDADLRSLRSNCWCSEGLKALAEALKVNRSILNIDLTRNSIGDEGAKALAEALKVNSSIVNIGLVRSQIGDEGLKALAEALKVNTSIANIDLAFNGRKEGLKALYEASKVNTMVNINVSPYAEVPSDQKDSSCRGPFGVPVRIEVLAEALKVNSSIGSIDFTARGIRDAEALAKALKVSRSITKINLSRTYIGDEGTKALAEALKVNSSIKNVDLSSNDIGDEGTKALAEALKVNSSITHIKFWRNEIGDEGAKALAEALKVNSSIIDITLTCNVIGDEGTQALAEALKVNSSIAKIFLGNNRLSEEGAKALTDAVEERKMNGGQVLECRW